MGRKIKNSDGQKATSKISLSVTPQMQDDIKFLAEIENGGNVNDFICGILELVIKKNSAAIQAVKLARQAYLVKISDAQKLTSFEFLAQDFKGGDSDA